MIISEQNFVHFLICLHASYSCEKSTSITQEYARSVTYLFIFMPFSEIMPFYAFSRDLRYYLKCH